MRLSSGVRLGECHRRMGHATPQADPKHYSLLRAAIVVAVAMATANKRNAAL